MAMINVRVIVNTELRAQYGNFRETDTQFGPTTTPCKYLVPVLRIPPAIIEVPNIDYEYFIDNIDSILNSIVFTEDFLYYKDHIDRIDTKKVECPETIPVEQVPIEYVVFKDGDMRRNTVTQQGVTIDSKYDEDDLFRTIMDDDDDDDDSDQDDMYVDNITKYVSPNFIFQKVYWHTRTDLLSFSFVKEGIANKKPVEPPKQRMSVWKMIKEYFYSSDKE